MVLYRYDNPDISHALAFLNAMPKAYDGEIYLVSKTEEALEVTKAKVDYAAKMYFDSGDTAVDISSLEKNLDHFFYCF